MNQIGGGCCSLCKSPGTNVSTCPLNAKAVKTNPGKHPLAERIISSVLRARGAPVVVPPLAPAAAHPILPAVAGELPDIDFSTMITANIRSSIGNGWTTLVPGYALRLTLIDRMLEILVANASNSISIHCQLAPDNHIKSGDMLYIKISGIKRAADDRLTVETVDINGHPHDCIVNKIVSGMLAGVSHVFDWQADLILACNDLGDPMEDDECVRQLRTLEGDPFYATDQLVGYTNNGFHRGWGLGRPKNVKFIVPARLIDIAHILAQLEPGIKVIVKNTGHDYIGRSYPGDNTLVVWTHKMDGICWRDNAALRRATNLLVKSIDDRNEIYCKDLSQTTTLNETRCLNSEHGYFTVAAGVQWWQIFDYITKFHSKTLGKTSVLAMKGASNTVGAAGGWILDGGFGLFTKLFGMGVDNVLTMTAVLADGKIVKANRLMNPDLFFALRGGGACNFAILGDVTYKLLPPLKEYGEFVCNLNASTEDQYKQMLACLFRSGLMTMKYLGGTIQMWRNREIKIWVTYANIPMEQLRRLCIIPFFEDIAATCGIVPELIDNLDVNVSTSSKFDFGKPNYGLLSIQPNSTIQDSDKQFTPSKKRWWTYESYNDYVVAFGSRYLLIDDVSNPEQCADKFLQILRSANMMQLEISKGLYGADQEIMDANAQTAMNPNVRRAVGLVYIRSYLQYFNPTVNQPFHDLTKVKLKYDDQKAVFQDWDRAVAHFSGLPDDTMKKRELRNYIMDGAERSHKSTMKGINEMRHLFIGNSTYINHSDVNEPEWGRVFWGDENFHRLIQLKQRYDPTDRFNHLYSIPLNA